MNKVSRTLLLMSALCACGRAFAGRDEALINATRKNQLAHDAKQAAQAAASRASGDTPAAAPLAAAAADAAARGQAAH